ncbi:hypothetical protein PHOBOS_246 [Erwinia phage vB_EamM_Phobos]|uniref:hypothetical protein n=1 Tax=Erwinia phage vB_EamM_Phobos TaxID=1883377 RepID=UPI00081CC684|nr:hypothetical protein BIZ79_gp246 [Erwinia phage vB_EamM_Phobos]ANZ50436.1 hypothetical protein PHOBOS_246 [Erwinia phage vB_EamM_Phobos]
MKKTYLRENLLLQDYSFTGVEQRNSSHNNEYSCKKVSGVDLSGAQETHSSLFLQPLDILWKGGSRGDG